MQNIYRHSNSKLFSLFLETAPFSTSFPKCFVPTGSSRAPKSCARVSQSQALHRPPETRRCHNPKLNWVCSLNQTMSRLVHWLCANKRLAETAKMEQIWRDRCWMQQCSECTKYPQSLSLWNELFIGVVWVVLNPLLLLWYCYFELCQQFTWCTMVHYANTCRESSPNLLHVCDNTV